MKYIALIYTDPALSPKAGSDESAAMMQGYYAATEVFKRDGVLAAGEPLEPVSTATSLRIRGGKTETMDGPFAETKEQLGGFYIFDCADLDGALKYAAMIPGAKYGTIEVRPILQMG